MARKKAEPIEEYDTYQCQTCQDKPEMSDKTELVAHLKGVHGLASPIQGTRQMIDHLDGSDWYGGTTRLLFAGVEIVYFYRHARDAEGRRMWR